MNGIDFKKPNTGTALHFLPVITTTPSSRREIELRQSSARSYLARSLHKRKRASSDSIPDNEDGDLIEDMSSSNQLITKSRDKKNAGNYLISGRVNIRAMPDIIVDSHTKMLLLYCIQFFWPGFELGSAAFHFPSFAVDYNALISQGPALVHAVLWQAAVSQAIRRKSKVTDKTSLWHYNQAINYISKEISRPIDKISEQTMYAILSLTGSELSPDEEDIISKRAFDPPLAELSWIHVFGSRLHIDAHAKALMRLVDLKGGIHSLKVTGFQASYNYMDLTRATQKLIKPHLPISHIYDQVKETHHRKSFFGYSAYFPLEHCAGNLSGHIENLSGHGLSEDVKQITCDLRVWVKVIEAYNHGGLSTVDHSLLAGHRDLIQQRLLGTLPNGFVSETVFMTAEMEGLQVNHGTWINDLVQTALLTFSLGVTFPITYAPPYHRLALRLQEQIEQYEESALELKLYDLLIWVGLLGVLCAEQVNDDRRERFIQHLVIIEQEHPATLGAREWGDVKQESLEPFLWSHISCDGAAKTAWDQVQRRIQHRFGSWETTAWPNMLGTFCG
ncbi:hypothetical protein FHETE_5983 [Fusarium heterosporum]|uniref:Uncharacterized protein n=1 Tax=Fusarium heterosporum TaxID=42747 RepID=A0A8H5WQI8_FUSHE|nr:hypothetical protein FHETE_5983 [Fusarium heterosporum]